MAFQRSVTLSGIAHATDPRTATDGYTGPLCTGPAIIHSEIGKGEIWLRVDLGGMKQIKFIDIYDRIIGPPYHQRLAYTDIIVYGQNPSDNRQHCSSVTIKDVESYAIFKVYDEILTGSGVELYQGPRDVGHMIHICELAVYGPPY